jgi:hypothetical protein
MMGLAAIAALAGCRFDESGPGFGDDDAGVGVDAPVNDIDSSVAIDAPPGTPDAPPGTPDAPPGTPDAMPPDAACSWPYPPTHVDPCTGPTPGPALGFGTAGTWIFDTDSGELTDPNDDTTTPTTTIVGGARVLWVADFTLPISRTLRAVGSRPLLVVSDSDISISGTVDVASAWDGDDGRFVSGAGANPSVCPISPPDPGQECAQHGGSGGGAGAFGGDGGDGGRGGDGRNCGGGNTSGIAGGAGGNAVNSTPTDLRGGCAGRDGSQNNSGTDLRGRGAPGGGAIHLMARGTLTVNGTINAGGGGGRAGLGERSGGGGGGSGGMIGLEATTLDVNATAALGANGGGGGGGADDAAASPGADALALELAAPGGMPDGNGTAGGNGGFVSAANGASATAAERGGGGGGGGVGFILLYSPNTPMVSIAATVSPAAATVSP